MSDETELIKKAEERLKQEGKEFKPETPAQETKRLNKELFENIEKFKAERLEMRKVVDEVRLSGKGLAGKKEPETQEEKDKAMAEHMSKELLGK